MNKIYRNKYNTILYNIYKIEYKVASRSNKQKKDDYHKLKITLFFI